MAARATGDRRSGGLGAPLTERPRKDGITAIDGPAKPARRVRRLSTGHGRKSDQTDALSVGIAAWSAPALRTVEVDEATAALRALPSIATTWYAPVRS